MKRILSLIGLVAALFVIAAPTALHTASAAEFIHPDKDNGSVTLSSGETHHNTYVAGGSVFINSTISGDLYAAGGNITVEGPVQQDVVIAGGNITLNGQIGGDVRIVGGDITINAPVGGEVLMAGGTLHLTEKAIVEGDLVVGGGEIIVEGPVKGQVKINGGVVKIDSAITGAVSVFANKSLTIGSKAIIVNPISYKGPQEADVQQGAQISNIDFQKVETHRGGQARHMFATLFTVVFVIKVIALILAGILLMKLFPRTTQELGATIHSKTWVNLGLGALGLIVTPIVFIILLITFIGWYIALFLIFSWVIMLLVSSVLASIYLGAGIIKLLTQKPSLVYDWQALVIGVVAIAIIAIIPFIGFLALLVLIMIAFGAVIRHGYSHVKAEHASSVLA